MDGRVKRLVGRQAELSALDGVLRTTLSGRFQLLAVTGEPGVGKSRLLDEVTAKAEQHGMCAARGLASEYESDLPLALVVDALDERLAGLREELGERLDRPAISLLASVFPSLAGEPADDARLSPFTRNRFYRAVRGVLEELAAPGGLALVLDDVHWADEASAELLGYLIRHPPDGSVLMAVAYRPAQAPSHLVKLVQPGKHAHRLTVDPLSRTEVEEFLGPAAGPARSQALYEVSGGNPFYLEVLADLGSPVMAEAMPGGLPADLRSALRLELDALPPDALLVAHGAAVAGEEFDLPILEVAAALPEEAVAESMDRLAARDVIRPARSASRFRFRHPLVRSAVYDSAGAGWRVRAHARIAAYLAEIGAPASLRAHHLVQSARPGDGGAIRTLKAAAQSAEEHAPATAARWLQAVLRLMPEEEPDRVEVLMELARLQAISGQLREGRSTAQQALRLLPDSDHARRASVVRRSAMMDRMLGRPAEGQALLTAELSRMPHPLLRAAVPLRLRLVGDNLMRGDVQAAQHYLDLIPEIPVEEEPGMAVAVAALRPIAAYSAGRADDALFHIEAAERLAGKSSDEHLAEWIDALSWFCWAQTLLGRQKPALHWFSRAVAVARSTGQTYILPNLLAGHARTLWQAGELSAAELAADEATEIGRSLSSVQLLTFGLTERCLVASWSGRHEEALRHAEEAMQVCAGREESWAATARYAGARALINSGEVSAGAQALAEVCTPSARILLDRATLLASYETMAFAEMAQERGEQATLWAERATRLAPSALPASQATARLSRAHALRLDEPAASAEQAARAAEEFTHAGHWVDAGRAWLGAGAAFTAANARGPARTALQRAAEIFIRCGAKHLLAETVREQRKIGVRVPSSPGRAAGPFGLSRREMDVAALAGEGSSNKQIAQQLSISIHTVETHLSHIFTKLGVTSRIGMRNALDGWI
ncbi:helix-turn-helix transcriptional regulator [Nonomuraea mesophila]|uniref:helix-turn-helix transcriptional regulator n=1 Tax=Nonomuraea mesophila TaxID=2530382 RepID=UPI001FE89897|nr:LuxR family transcriptional regulator [Nonomuraea mesophila]